MLLAMAIRQAYALPVPAWASPIAGVASWSQCNMQVVAGRAAHNGNREIRDMVSYANIQCGGEMK